MTEPYRLRPFEPGDLARLQEIREAAYEPVFRSFRSILGAKIAPIALATLEQEQADYLERVCNPTTPQDMYVVVAGSDIVGFCAVSLDRQNEVGEIDLNAVDPDHQGKGIGTWMYDAVLELMKADGMRAATVGTGGDPSHAPARRAYEKAGFNAAIPSVYLYRSL